jgi:4-hydroxybenzoate polyprenyltransferase
LGLFGAPLLLVVALGIAFCLSVPFTVVLVGYFIMSTAYSWYVKQVAVPDVFFLAALYTIRLIASHVAGAIPMSTWLLVFSMFIFLSLALMKRFQELQALQQQNGPKVKDRGYTAADLVLVTTLGLVSSFMAVPVLALYVNSEQVVKLYARPTPLLLVCPLMLYWITRGWFFTHRGRMHHDPTAFAFKDWVSYAIDALMLTIMWFATR